MEKHSIIFPTLQKYYSTLKSLGNFGLSGNFFDDVSSLDTFFSEFRSVTFVIQKAVGAGDGKQIYEKLRDEHLTGDSLKWFMDVRNKVVHQNPFPLKKALIIDVYLVGGTVRLNDPSLLVDLDKTFDEALTAIKNIFISKLKLIEVFFSARVIFNEDGADVELYPKIKDGLSQMNIFMRKMQEQFPCACANCTSLKKLIESVYEQVFHKELSFVNDYAYELDKELTVAERGEIYLGIADSASLPLSEIRVQPLGSLFEDNDGCIFTEFEKFIISHIVMFQMQEHSIMPVFIINFNDNTQQIMPFISDTKTTFYRKVNEVAEKINFEDVIAVFFCGEQYLYEPEKYDEVFRRPYSERRLMASKEILYFNMILKGGYEWFVFFDESKIDDMKYVKEQIKNIQKADESDNDTLHFLAPIKAKLNPENKTAEKT